MGIVGGGISGLAAAWHLVEADPSLQVVVLDSSDRPGGKLRGGLVAGVPTDLGAESVLARRPEGVELAAAVGLADRIVHPAVGTASIWSRGALHPMPTGTLMGVPGTPAAALGVLDADEIARAERERDRSHPPVEVRPVGRGVRRVPDGARRRGPPRRAAAGWGLRRARPPVVAAGGGAGALGGRAVGGVDLGRRRARRVRRRRPHAARCSPGSAEGSSSWPGRSRSVLTSRGVRILSGTTVRAVERTGHGWRLVSGPVPAPEQTLVDAVILAVPGAPTARLLGDVSGQAATAPRRDPLRVDGHRHPRAATARPAAAARVGLPRAAGRGPGHQGGHLQLHQVGAGSQAAAPDLSCCGPRSAGRARRPSLQRSDAELVGRRARRPGRSAGAPLPTRVDSHVQRWGGALPQYAVGHVDRVARIRELVGAVAGLEVAGAAYDGVGVPACIGSGRAAAAATLTHLRSRAGAGEMTA